MNAVTFHRVARWLRTHHLGIPATLADALTFLIFNCSIPSYAQIGAGSRCEHRGIGVTINRAAIIGRRCSIGPHVVIGGRGSGRLGVPVIGDDVVLSAGAKILGRITIGNGAVVGANAVVLDDVEPGEVVAGIPARPLHK